MTIKLTVVELKKGPFLKLIFSIIDDSTSGSKAVSNDFNVNDLAVVKLKFVTVGNSSSCPCFLSLMKHQSAKNYTVKINIICERNGYSKEFICTEKWTDWIDIDNDFQMNFTNHVYTFVIAMSVIKLEPKSFVNLYDETDFCDFRLSTADGSGSVAVHKVCLVTHSDTFKRMLSGKWKETEEGCIEIKNVTLRTLQNLKKYIYLGILPEKEDDLCQLLLIANCYLIEDLKEECIATLARVVQSENLQMLQEFAFDNKLPELMWAIVYFTPGKTIETAHKVEIKKLAGSEAEQM